MSRRSLTIVLGLATGYFLLLAAASVNWRMMHDAVMVMYPAFLMNHFHMVPFRDFFDLNLPETYLVYYLAGRFTGFGDFGFRLFDLAWLGATMALTYLWMRTAGKFCAWAAAIGVGIAYLQAGPMFSLERDFFMLLPLVGAIQIARGDRQTLARAIAAGAGVGCTAMIKPQAALFILPVWYFNFIRRDPESPSVSRLAGSTGMAAGFLVPVILSALWLAWNHALASFLDMAINYYPLYGNFFENRLILDPLQRLNVILAQAPKFGGQTLWLVPAGIGIYLGLEKPDGKVRTLALMVLALMLIAMSLPAIAGQFFPYHWMPLQYFAIVGAALCLGKIEAGLDRIARLFPPLIFVVALAVCAIPQKGLLKPIAGVKLGSPKTERADAIAQILSPRMQPGDRIQPLDWTSGAVQSMLELKARPATSFLFTYIFHHNIYHPYILRLRRQFMTELKASPPRFMIRVDADRPWFVGPLTDMTFPEFDAWLAANYKEIARGKDFVIFEIAVPMGGK